MPSIARYAMCVVHLIIIIIPFHLLPNSFPLVGGNTRTTRHTWLKLKEKKFFFTLP